MDYGFRVSQKGYDAQDCDDRHLAFSSSFQTLKIFNRYSLAITMPGLNSSATGTITHNLGFYAPFIVIFNGPNNDISRVHTKQNRYNIEVKQYQNSFEIKLITTSDSRDNYGNVVAGNPCYFTVYIFNDDFRLIPERIITAASGVLGSTKDYGIRLSKDGYDVKNCTDDQLIFSSSMFNALVHMKGTTTDMFIDHTLGYPPMLMVFGRYNTNNYIEQFEAWPPALFNLMGGGATGKFYKCNSSSASWGDYEYTPPDDVDTGHWVTGWTFYYIILKDKLSG